MSKVGIARQAYTGAPRGVRHVWPEEFDISPKEHWSWQKRDCRNKLVTILNPEYKRKLDALIDSI